jgi:hypothetical protein
VTGGNLGGERIAIGDLSERSCPERAGGGRAAMAPSRPTRQRTRPRTRPLPRGTFLYTPNATPGRRTTERRSARLLIFLHQLPVWVAPVVLVVFLVAGLAMHGPAAAAALVVVAAALAWLAAISWPRISASGRGLRVVAVAVVLAVAVYKALH